MSKMTGFGISGGAGGGPDEVSHKTKALQEREDLVFGDLSPGINDEAGLVGRDWDCVNVQGELCFRSESASRKTFIQYSRQNRRTLCPFYNAITLVDCYCLGI